MNVKKSAIFILIPALILLTLAVAVACRLWGGDADKRIDSFAPDARHRHAQAIVDALNTHDPAKLTSMRSSSPGHDVEIANAYSERIIRAAMPLPGCSYVLDSVLPQGEEMLPDAPWVYQHQAYRYDMMLTENCPDKMPLSRVISVLSTRGEGGHWTEAFFEIKQ